MWSWALEKQREFLSTQCLQALKFYEDWETRAPNLSYKREHLKSPSYADEMFPTTSFFAQGFHATTAYFAQHHFTYDLPVKAHSVVNCRSFEQAVRTTVAKSVAKRDTITIPGSNEPYQGGPDFH